MIHNQTNPVQITGTTAISTAAIGGTLAEEAQAAAALLRAAGLIPGQAGTATKTLSIGSNADGTPYNWTADFGISAAGGTVAYSELGTGSVRVDNNDVPALVTNFKAGERVFVRELLHSQGFVDNNDQASILGTSSALGHVATSELDALMLMAVAPDSQPLPAGPVISFADLVGLQRGAINSGHFYGPGYAAPVSLTVADAVSLLSGFTTGEPDAFAAQEAVRAVSLGHDFVTQLYTDILGRAPDAPGAAAWAGALASGQIAPTDAVEGFVQSQEFAQIVGLVAATTGFDIFS